MSKIDKYPGVTRGERYQECVVDLLERILEAVQPKVEVTEVPDKPKVTRKKKEE